MPEHKRRHMSQLSQLSQLNYVLIAKTTGDDLIPSNNQVIATSASRQALETLQADRLAERTAWLATHEVPWWQQEAVIASEEVVAVHTV